MPKAILYTIIIILSGCLITLLWLDYSNRSLKSLYGKEILYKNTYSSSRIGVNTNKEPIIFGCELISASVVITSDTVELKSENQTMGLKPLNNIYFLSTPKGLLCKTKEGTFITLMKIILDGVSQNNQNELLIVSLEKQFLILGHGCNK